jgi:hypothetical protein
MRCHRLLAVVLLAALASGATLVHAQMPSQKEMDDAMREMRKQMDKLTPEQRKMIEETQRQMMTQPAASPDDIGGVPRRDGARIAKVPKAPLTGTQLKAHVEALQPKLAQALSPAARQRAQAIEASVRKEGGAVPARLAAAANGLAAMGAWPEATYLMGKAAVASGSAQDLNNLAAFLTMQKAGHAAAPILITLDARYPNNSTLLNNLGQAWFELGEVKEAERVLIMAVRRAPNHPQANVTKSVIEEARGDKAAAQASMRAAIRGGYSEAKEQRLAKLGGKLAKDDVRWTLKKPADTLGLANFVPPPYAMKVPDLWLLPPMWAAFNERVNAERDRYKTRAAELAKQTPWLADAALRGPVTAKAARFAQLNGDDWTRRLVAARGAYTEALRFDQQQRKALEDRLEAIHAEGRTKYRNVAGGYQYDYVCPQIRAEIAKYLEATAPRLEEARRDLLASERLVTNEHLYYAQFMQTQRSFEYSVVRAKSEFLAALGGSSLNTGTGLMNRYGQNCLKPDAPGKAGGKLPDFDEVNCQHIVDLSVQGIGSIKVRCNRMDTSLEPFALPFKAAWSEDLNKNRVLSASTQIDVKGMSVAARGEFDDQGLARGGVSVGTGVGDSVAGGPLEIGVGAAVSVGIDFDRSGVTDVRIEGGVGATAASSVPGTNAGTSASTSINSTWSWNTGASAEASGGFDASVF